MNNSILFVCFLLFYIICSCTNNLENMENVEAVAVEGMLVANAISIDTEIFRIREFKNINNKYLIVVDQREEGIFQVFSLPELDFLYAWGDRGRGPDEFSFISFNSFNVKDEQIILYEPSLNNLKYYTVTDTTLIFKEKLSLYYKGQNMPLNNLQRLNDSLYIADYGFRGESSKEFIALPPDSDRALFTFGEYPRTQLEGIERAENYFKTNAAKPDGSKFVAFYLYHNMFSIYDSEGLLIKRGKVIDEFLSEDDSNKNEFVYRQSIYASNNYIYVLAPNITEDDIFNDPEAFKPIIEIWNWNGQPLSRFRLDKPAQKFTVSEKEQKLYTFSGFNLNEIYEYDLSSILNTFK